MNKLFSWLSSFFSQLELKAANSVTNLSHEDNARFTKFCQFVWIQGEPIPLIYDIKNEVYSSQDVTLPMLKHFEALGLLTVEPRGYIKKRFGKHMWLFYAGKPTKIAFPTWYAMQAGVWPGTKSTWVSISPILKTSPS